MYATFAEFVEIYPDACAEVDYPPAASAASDVIDILTNFRVQEIGFDSLPESIKSKVKRAEMAQTAYIIQNGGVESTVSGTANGSYTVGSVSVSDGGTSNNVGAEINASPVAVAWLAKTGLLYRGVGTC